MSNQKFTQEVKDKWVEALESKNYVQGYASLYDNNPKRHCCIGVLGAICPFLDNDSVETESNPYIFLDNTIGEDLTHDLWTKNDLYARNRSTRPVGYKDDYSNVIEIIKNLPVQN